MRPEQRGKKTYTYLVSCSFELQYTFTESEVEQDPEGDEGDVCPTDDALATLERDLLDTLGDNYAIESLEACADSDALLGVDEESSDITPDHGA